MKQKNLIKKTVDKNSTNAQQGFCVRRAEVQNSGFVLLLTFVSQLRQAETHYLQPYKHNAHNKQTTIP
mgnify:CR=1 FL=1